MALTVTMLQTEYEQLLDEIDRLHRVLHDIAEEWSGAECGEPVYAQEAYAIGLAKRMYDLAASGVASSAFKAMK